jgi:hypothetical protein
MTRVPAATLRSGQGTRLTPGRRPPATGQSQSQSPEGTRPNSEAAGLIATASEAAKPTAPPCHHLGTVGAWHGTTPRVDALTARSVRIPTFAAAGKVCAAELLSLPASAATNTTTQEVAIIFSTRKDLRGRSSRPVWSAKKIREPPS